MRESRKHKFSRRFDRKRRKRTLRFGLNLATVGSRADHINMIAAVEANNLQPVIDKTFALPELAEAFRYQESQQHFGKICLSL